VNDVIVDTLNVELGSRSYPILIAGGLLERPEIFQQSLRARELLIVSNTTVAPLYLSTLRTSLGERRVVEVILPDGEAHKTLANAARVLDVLVANRLARDAAILALGGGVVGDLAGFAAACYQRGIDFVQLPTTLLAQVDSAVGGKTGVNHAGGKNLIGAFHQPVLVVADTAILDTLPARQFRAGYAEVVKYGLLGDAAFFSWLEVNAKDIFTGTAARERAIATCCRMKADIVARDERETGERALLNLGHTFGHAFEAAAGFSDRLLHGEAIALGMTLAFQFSTKLGFSPPADTERMLRHLAAVGLPTHVSDIPGDVPGADQLMDLMAQDKKVKRGKLTFILTHGIGAAFVAPDIDPVEVRAFIAEKLA
jgi:3-dehydroquinate synthase